MRTKQTPHVRFCVMCDGEHPPEAGEVATAAAPAQRELVPELVPAESAITTESSAREEQRAAAPTVLDGKQHTMPTMKISPALAALTDKIDWLAGELTATQDIARCQQIAAAMRECTETFALMRQVFAVGN